MPVLPLQPRSFQQQYRALAATVYLLTMSAASFSIFLGSFLGSRHIAAQQVGMIGAAGSAAIIAGNLLWGFISDLTGRRRALIAMGSLVSVPTLLLWLTGTNVLEYVVLNGAYNFFVAPTVALLSVFVLDILPPEARATRFGGFRVWGSLGLLSASWGLGWFLKANPDRLFYVAAFTTGIAMIPFLLGTSEQARPRSNRFHFRHVLLNPRLSIFFLCTCLHGFWEPGAFLFLSYSLKQQHATEGIIGIILGMNGLVAMASLPIAGRMADRWGRKPLLLAMYLLSGIRMLLYSVLSNPLAYIPVQLLHFGSFGISEGVGSVYVAEMADERDRATALACFHIFHSVGALAGSLAGGYLSSTYGLPAMYQAFAVVMVVAALVFFANWKTMKGL